MNNKFINLKVMAIFILMSTSIVAQTSALRNAYFSSDHDNLWARTQGYSSNFLGNQYNLDGASKFTVEAWVYHSDRYFRTNAQGGDSRTNYVDNRQQRQAGRDDSNYPYGYPFVQEGKEDSYHHNHHWFSYGKDGWGQGFQLGFGNHGNHKKRFEFVPYGGDDHSVVDDEELLRYNEWMHMAASFDNGIVTLFINGEEVHSARVTNNFPQAIGQSGTKDWMMIGNAWHWGGDNSFNGFLKLVRVWKDVALDAETINTFKSTYVTSSSDFHPEAENLILNMPLTESLAEKEERKYWWNGWGHSPTMHLNTATYWVASHNSDYTLWQSVNGHNLRASGGNNPHIIGSSNSDPLNGATVLTWDLSESPNPTRFKVHRALKTEQTNPLDKSHDGFVLAETVDGDARAHRDIPPDDKIYFYKIESDFGDGGLPGGTYMVTGKANMIAPKPSNIYISEDQANSIDLTWDPVEENSPSEFFINQSFGQQTVITGGDRIIFPVSKAIDEIDSKMSIDFWFVPGEESGGYLDVLFNVNDSKNKLYYHTDGYFAIKWADSEYMYTDPVHQNKKTWDWKHVAITHDGTNLKIIFNGQQIFSRELDFSKIEHSIHLQNLDKYYYDNFRVWSQAKNFTDNGLAPSNDNIFLGRQQYGSILQVPSDLKAYYTFDGANPKNELTNKSLSAVIEGSYSLVYFGNNPWFTHKQPAGSQRAVITNNEAEKDYHFTMATFNTAGVSDHSGVIGESYTNNATGRQVGDPGSPEHVSVKSKDGDFHINWTYNGPQATQFKIIQDGSELGQIIGRDDREFIIENPEGEACAPISIAVKVINDQGEVTSVNSSLKFSGHSTEVDLDNAVQLDEDAFNSTTHFTTSFLMKFTGSEFKDSYLLHGVRANGVTSLRIKIKSNGKIEFLAGSDENYIDKLETNTLSIDDIRNKWVHLVFSKVVSDDLNYMAIHLNNEEVASSRFKTRIIQNSTRVILGGGAGYGTIGSGQFEGNIDEFIVAPAVFGQSSITKLYENANNTKYLDNPVPYIRLHHTFDYKDPQNIIDSGPNGQHGRIMMNASINYEDVASNYNEEVLLPTKVLKVPNLSNDIGDEGLVVSKGFYNDRIKIEWPATVMPNVSRFKIYRQEQILNSLGPKTLVHTEESKVLTSWEDIANPTDENSINLGELYYYSATAELDCENDIITMDFSPVFGFAEPSGIVSGNIKYLGTEVNVPNVDVVLQPDDGNQLGYSAQFNGTDNVLRTELKLGSEYLDEVTMEAWFMPTRLNHNTTQFLFGSGEATDGRNVFINKNNKLYVGIGGDRWFTNNTILILNQWYHIAVVYNDSENTVDLYLNGEKSSITSLGGLGSNIAFSVAGENGGPNWHKYKGLLDELRVWDTALDSTTIQYNRKSYLNGSEDNLILYYRFNFALDIVHDRSRSIQNGEVVWNLNNAEIGGDEVNFSYSVPSVNILSHRSITSIEGDYNISGIFYTDPSNQGQSFTLTPIRNTDNFLPATTTVNLGKSTPIRNNVNFSDRSSAIVTGNIKYELSNDERESPFVDVPSSNIEILVDGKSTNPKTITDALGNYRLTVPLGRHIIKPSLPLHTFEYEEMRGINAFYDFGRSLDSDNDGIIDTIGYSFSSAGLQGLNFIDKTKLKVVGRVVGGWRELEKFYGTSTNNIGTATLRFSSQDGKLNIETQTDPETGIYRIDLPPKRFNVLTTINNSPTMLPDPGSGNLSFDLSVPNVQKIVNGEILWQGAIGDTSLYEERASDENIIDNILLTETTFSVSDGSIFSSGDYFKLDDEVLLVSQIDNNTITVERGKDGSKATNHPSGSSIILLNRVEFNKSFNVIHYEVPVLNVTSENGEELPTSEVYKMSDNSTSMIRTYFNESGPSSLDFDDTKWPIFEQDKIYKAKIEAFQEYENRDGVNPDDATPPEKIDRVPIKRARITMSNRLAHDNNSPEVGGGNYIIEMSNDLYVNADSDTFQYKLGDTLYTFQAGYPNVLIDEQLEDYSYTETWSMVLQEKNAEGNLVGSAVDWYPNGQYDVNLLEAQSKSVFRGIVTGVKTMADGFETEGPDEIFLILRDPPGSQSYSFFEKNSTFCIDESYSLGGTTGNSIQTAVGGGSTNFIGAGGGLLGPIFLSKITDTEVLGGGGVSFEQKLSSSENQKICFTLSESFKTSSDNVGSLDFPELFVGSMADIFVGYSRNFGIGQARILSIDLTNGEVVLNNTIAVQTNSIQSTFIYTENHIREKVLPNYIEIRNQYLEQNSGDDGGPSLYWINFGTTAEDSLDVDFDEKYGSNNDDPIWEGNGRTSSSVSVLDTEDLDGPSYTFNQVSSPNGVDSVRWFNQNIRIWKKLLKDNQLAKKNSRLIRNISFNGGVTYNYSEMNSTASSFTEQYEFQNSNDINVQIETELFGFDFENQIGFNVGVNTGETYQESEDKSISIGFELSDSDPEDYFSVNVREDPIYRTPVFQLVSGATQNPWERGLSFEDASGDNYVFSEPTLQIQKPTINVVEPNRFNLAYDDDAIYELILGNESEINVRKVYLLTAEQNTNPYGATIRYNGDPFSNGTPFLLEPGEQKRVTITVSRPPIAYTLGNQGVELSFTDEFGSDENVKVVTSPRLRATWDPVCSPLELSLPKDNWVTNNFDKEIDSPVYTKSIEIKGYNKEQGVLEAILLQYKAENGQEWNNIEKFWKRPSNGELDVTKSYIPIADDKISFEWDVTGLGDGNYELRAYTDCGTSNIIISNVNKGTIDRVDPHLFNFPYNGDVVIINHDDDLSFQLNEPIDGSLLGTGSFDIRSEMNYGEVSHEASISFGGNTNDYLTINTFNGGLTSTSLTLELWVKRSQENTEEVIFSHGSPSPGVGFEFGFLENNKAFINVNGESFISNEAFDFAYAETGADWHHYAIAIDPSGLTSSPATPVQLWLYRDGQVVTTSSSTSSQSLSTVYTGTGVLTIGKGLGNAKPFKGNIHDFRIWNTYKTYTQVYAYLNKNLKGTEKDLVGYWRMDDAYGNLAEDRSRDNHAILYGVSWEVNRYSSGYGGGKALSLANNGHIRIPDSTELTLNNLTLEAWIRIDAAADRTVFMKGEYGYGLSIDSSNKLRFWSTGDRSISDAVVSNMAISLGNWHHIAVSSDGAVVKFYIDGKFAGNNRTDAAFTSANGPLYVGKSGLIGSDYFNGIIDEVRVWNTVRTSRQIKRMMRHALHGDESGLVWYLPFERWSAANRLVFADRLDHTLKVEKYTTNHADRVYGPLSDTTLVLETPSPFLFFDGDTEITDLQPDSTTGNLSIDYTSEASSMKSAKPYERHSFKFSLNQGQIKLWPDKVDHHLEGQLVDVTLREIYDFNGNRLSSPVTIHAFYDRNPVQWNVSDILIAQETSDYTGHQYSFNKIYFDASISNRSGKDESFTITGMPDWLKVSENSGLIKANSTFSTNRLKNLTFTINEGLNTGTYNELINVESSFGTSHRLPVEIKILRTPPYWVKPENKSHMMRITGRIKVDGVVSDDIYDRVAAYVGSDLRGWTELEYVERIDEYIFFLSIYSNQSSGETVKLKVWNASNGRLHPTVTPTFTFTANETNGKPTSPLDFEASTDVVQWLTLKSGANWTSINVTPTDLKANSVFSSNLGAIDSIVTQSGNNIKSSGSFSSSLTLDNTSMVKIYGNTTKEFEIEGLPLTPSSTSISLAQGWNWISFTPNFNLETNEALANYSAKDGDVISSYSDFSIYDSETGWIGTLNIMAPGNGYMLYTSNASPGTLIYPDGGIYLRTPTLKLLSKGYEDIGWEIDNEYKYSMYLIAGVNMNEVSISLNDQLAAFSNGELIGHAMPVAVNDTLLYFMNIYSNEKINSEKISFKVFSKRDGNIKSILQKVSFNNNQILGSINKPLSFSRSSLTKNDNGYVPNEFVLDQNYPNPFNPRTKIGFGVPQSGPVRIMVYNLLGQEVISLWDGNLEPGYKFVTWDGTDQIGNQVSAGIYILLMDSPGFRKSRKMLLIK